MVATRRTASATWLPLLLAFTLTLQLAAFDVQAEVTQRAVTQDDECSPPGLGDGECSLSALQLRGRLDKEKNNSAGYPGSYGGTSGSTGYNGGGMSGSTGDSGGGAIGGFSGGYSGGSSGGYAGGSSGGYASGGYAGGGYAGGGYSGGGRSGGYSGGYSGGSSGGYAGGSKGGYASGGYAGGAYSGGASGGHGGYGGGYAGGYSGGASSGYGGYDGGYAGGYSGGYGGRGDEDYHHYLAQSGSYSSTSGTRHFRDADLAGSLLDAEINISVSFPRIDPQTGLPEGEDPAEFELLDAAAAAAATDEGNTSLAQTDQPHDVCGRYRIQVRTQGCCAGYYPYSTSKYGCCGNTRLYYLGIQGCCQHPGRVQIYDTRRQNCCDVPASTCTIKRGTYSCCQVAWGGLKARHHHCRRRRHCR